MKVRLPSSVGALACGLCFGLVDRWMAHGPAWSLNVSNVAALWVAAAFLVGMTAPSRPRGAALGLVLLGAALTGYYGWIAVVERTASTLSLTQRAAPWIAASVVVGPVFGWLGSAWSAERSRLAALLVSSAFVIDGLAYVAIDGRDDQTNVLVHLAMAAVGVGLGSSLLLRRRGSNEFRTRSRMELSP
jgi:Family of unknown function (DUF6518)